MIIYLAIVLMVQVFCIYISLFIKNWDDDLISIITYVVVQGLIAALLVYLVPWLINESMNTLNPLILLYYVLGTMFIAWWRMVNMIPLEGTVFNIEKPKKVDVIQIDRALSIDKLKIMASISPRDPHAAKKYKNLRETLIRISNEPEKE